MSLGPGVADWDPVEEEWASGVSGVCGPTQENENGGEIRQESDCPR